MTRREIPVLKENGARGAEGSQVERIVALGRALSDPIRVRMVGMLAAEAAEGRGCCDLPDLGVPVGGETDSPGICVCEFEGSFGMGQSKVSYHLGKLKEAGLVREEKRGKWIFYSLDGGAVRELLSGVEDYLSAEQGRRVG